ncbi:MAG TPA: formylglycine-generating enzyme family protein [Lentisphaeria bacterium]|nr:formylglycine-generating enzyme family protein [Lentisphaeria bacterium]
MQNEKACLSYCFVFVLFFALSAQAAPLVSNIVAGQRAGTKLVDITYNLTDAENTELTVTIRISKDAGATWDVPCTSVSGNGIDFPVTPGRGKAIVWDAGADWNGQWSDQMRVKITAIANVAPERNTYLVIDLSAGPEASNYPVSYLPEVPDGGWTDEYKTTKLVLRRIPAGTFTMGSPGDEIGRYNNETQHQVTLTKDFHVGVFAVTQKQWERIMGNWPSYYNSYRDSRPVESISYEDIRGNGAGSGWPANNDVDADSFLGRLRTKTGLDFDLPTEAQWEYACRAETKTALNSGKNLTSEEQCPNMAEVGRYWYNGGSNPSGDGRTAKVGSYLPNQWGLYDMHGNVWEWCLDWHQSELGSSAQTDPRGAAGGTARVTRGGSWFNAANLCRSACRNSNPPTWPNTDRGFRLVRTVP